MRIGIDVSLLSGQYDGIGIYIFNQLVYLHENNDDNEYYLYSNLPLVNLPKLDDRFYLRVDNLSGHLIWLLRHLPQKLKNDKIDVFWQPNFIFPHRIKGMKNIVTIHDLSAYAYTEFSSTKANITHRLLLKPTCKKADKILAISNNCKSEIIRYLSADADKIITIYNGKKLLSGCPTDENEISNCLKQYNIKKNEYLLFVGTLSPRKNDEVIVNAYFNYLKRGGTKKLVIAGNIAAKSTHIKDLISNSEYKENIILTGYITDKEKDIFYYNAFLSLYPSRLEGFGFPLLEAMQARIPVITSNTSCMPEIAQDAAVYLNNIDDYIELADRIFDVENMTELQREELIKKGLKRVEFFEGIDYRKKTLEAIESTYTGK